MVLTRRQSHLIAKDEDSLSELASTKLSEKKGSRKSAKGALQVEEGESDNEVQQDLAEEIEQESNEKQSSSDEDDSNSEEEEEDDDEDIDALLDKAEQALRNQNSEMTVIDAKVDYKSFKLPKLDAGISVQDQLYIISDNDRAKMAQEIAALDDGSEGSSSTKAISVLKASKTDVPNKSRAEKQKERETTAGKGWFDMPKTEITPEIKRDLQVIRLRNVLDRKRHYKKGDSKDPTYFQMGTVIEGPTEFFSSRLTKRERKQTIVDELLADEEARGYYKRRFIEVQSRTQSGGKKHYKKQKAKRAQKW